MWGNKREEVKYIYYVPVDTYGYNSMSTLYLTEDAVGKFVKETLKKERAFQDSIRELEHNIGSNISVNLKVKELRNIIQNKDDIIKLLENRIKNLKEYRCNDIKED